jgi:hypothetical protein
MFSPAFPVLFFSIGCVPSPIFGVERILTDTEASVAAYTVGAATWQLASTLTGSPACPTTDWVENEDYDAGPWCHISLNGRESSQWCSSDFVEVTTADGLLQMKDTTVRASDLVIKTEDPAFIERPNPGYDGINIGLPGPFDVENWSVKFEAVSWRAGEGFPVAGTVTIERGLPSKLGDLCFECGLNAKYSSDDQVYELAFDGDIVSVDSPTAPNGPIEVQL